MTRNVKNVVEEVLTPQRARELWTANYFPALPLTPQHFEVGALLPAMLYMARWGHRRGKGTFIETFGRNVGGTRESPNLEDVAKGLLLKAPDRYDGFEGETGTAMLADLLLTYCLENKGRKLGHGEPVQRVFPTHYLASWVDLPVTVTHLRGVPEFLTALLAWQERGKSVASENRGRFPVGCDFKANPLLDLFARHMIIRGKHSADFASDQFMEGAAHDLGVDELLAVRLALACEHAPMKPRGRDEAEPIPNRWPVADAAAKTFRRDLATFIEVYGRTVPRQTFLPLLEAGIGLGLTNLLLTTTACLYDWEQNGILPKGRSPWPLFVDCSHGQNTKLRNVSEAAMAECLARYERLPIFMMLLRLLDDRVHHDPKMRGDLPEQFPDASAWLNLLGDVYHGRHARSDFVLERIEEECGRLAEALQDEGEAPEAVEILRRPILNPAMRMAEVLTEMMGDTSQRGQFTKALESAFMSDRPNGLVHKRRVSRTEAGTRKANDQRSIVLSQALLDFLVHRHLRKDAKGKHARPLSLKRFLEILRKSYGLHVDEEPLGGSVPQELLHANKAWLERRLRDLGLLVGVNDAESMKQLKPRFLVPETVEEDAGAGT